MEELDRIQYRILETLFQNKATNPYHGMTISEVEEKHENRLGIRMTVWRKAGLLVKNCYIAKGVMAGRSDTYYLLEKGINVCQVGL